MAQKRKTNDLSVEELRRLLMEKQREAHQERLDAFRRSGRVVRLVADPSNQAEGGDPAEISSLPEDTVWVSTERRRRKKHRVFDRLLLIMEIAAIAGLLFVIFSGLNLIRDLNREVASALEQPTLTPTPMISAVVLPSGHTPPGSPGGVQPNNAEVPEQLQPVLKNLSVQPAPTQGPGQAIRIQIPAIQVDAPVVQGDSWEQLKKGVAQHIGTTAPGQNGNLVLSAHNDVFGEIFRNLDRLKAGDMVILYTSQRQFPYVITGSKIVTPTRVDVMSSTDQPTLTLISCYPYLVDNKRIVVTAQLQPNS